MENGTPHPAMKECRPSETIKTHTSFFSIANIFDIWERCEFSAGRYIVMSQNKAYFKDKLQNIVIAMIDDIPPFYSFSFVVFLLAGEYVIHEILLEFFI